MENTNIYYLEEAPIGKAVANLSIPMILAMFIGVIQNLTDSFFIGKLGDTNMLSAVMLCLPILTVIMAIANVFGVGGSSYISRLLGEKNYSKVKEVSSFSFYGLIISGILITLLCYPVMNNILPLIGTSSNTFIFSKIYASIIVLSSTIFVLSFGLGALIRAEGAAKESMIGMIISTLGNIILAPLLIIFLKLGVAGSAYASLIANFLSVMYYVWYFVFKSPYLSIKVKDLKISLDIVKNVFGIGLPVLIQFTFMMASSIILNTYAGKYGDFAIAVVGLAIQINMIPEFLVSGLCEGIQPLLGYNYSSGNIKRLDDVMKFTSKWSIGISSVIGLLSIIFGKYILQLFIKEPTILSTSIPLFKILIMAQIAYGIIFLITNYFQAIGKAKESTIMAFVQGIGFIPAVIIGDYFFKIKGIVWAFPISEFLIAIVALILFVNIKKMTDKSKIDNEVLAKA